MRANHLSALILLCCLPTWAQAQSNAERYMLQERCGKQAAATFRQDWEGKAPGVMSGNVTANYENHYSERLNKCFYMEKTQRFEMRKDRGGNVMEYRLYDINENKEYGTFAFGVCTVGEATCGSEQEFLKLIKQYMEN